MRRPTSCFVFVWHAFRPLFALVGNVTAFPLIVPASTDVVALWFALWQRHSVALCVVVGFLALVWRGGELEARACAEQS